MIRAKPAARIICEFNALYLIKNERKYNLFSIFKIICVAALLIVGGVSLLIHDWPLGERLALLGVWVIVSFFIMVGVEGNARGVRRVDVRVPSKWAIISFGFAFALFVAGGVVYIR